MSFQDLPKNFRELPLTDPVLAADVVDLVCSEYNRAQGCLMVLICDADQRPIQPIMLEGRPDLDGEPISSAGLRNLATAVDECGASALIAVGKPAGPVDDRDRRLHQRLLDAFAERGVPIIATYLATCERIVRMPDFSQFAPALGD